MKHYCRSLFVFLMVLFLFAGFSSCSDEYDDEAIWQKVNELTDRIQKLENVCNQTNANIASLQTILDALKENYSIVSVNPLDGNVGYVMNFSNGESITIYNGTDGKDGIDGTDGKDGKDGEDGKDGKSPQLTIKMLSEGVYCWMLDGEILKDANGIPIPVNGKDGADGSNGISSPVPQLKTGSQLYASGIDGNWERDGIYITVDGGRNWVKISATNESSIFTSIDTSNPNVVSFILSDGSKLSIARTDNLFSMLLGNWKRHYDYYGNPDESLILNADYTYQKSTNGSTLSGTFDLFPTTGTFILWPYESYTVYTIIDITEYRLIVRKAESDGVGYYYRENVVVLETNELQVPKEGGTYQIKIDSKIPVSLNGNSIDDQPLTESVYKYDGKYMSDISLTKSLEDQTLKIVVNPASAINMRPQIINITDERNHIMATLTIRQDGNEIVSPFSGFSEYGSTLCRSALERVNSALSFACYAMDMPYTGIYENSAFKAPLSDNNQALNNAWYQFYDAIRMINNLQELANNEIADGPLQAPLNVLKAMCYYHLITYWGDIPYQENSMETVSPQYKSEQTFSLLIPQLQTAIETLEEKRNVNYSSDDEDEVTEAILLSKDIARIVLAKIYMYQGNYKDAKALLEKVVSNGFYQLENTTDYASIQGNELIFSINKVNAFTYSDVLLSLAECELYAGTENAAEKYLSQIIEKKAIEFSNSNLDIKNKLHEIYKIVLSKSGNYFAFLKRNNLAEKEIGLAYSYYLLFPFPLSELMNNPNLIQNPGY